MHFDPTMSYYGPATTHPNDPRNSKEFDICDVIDVLSLNSYCISMVQIKDDTFYVVKEEEPDLFLPHQYTIQELFDEYVENNYDPEEWDTDYVYECFIEDVAHEAGIHKNHIEHCTFYTED